MTPSGLANWIAVAALAVMLFAAVIPGAVAIGRLFQKVADLKDVVGKLEAADGAGQSGHYSLREAFARLEERMGQVENGLRDLANNIALAPPPGYAPRARKPQP